MEEYENPEFLKLKKEVEAFVETLKETATPKQLAFVLSVVAAETIFRSMGVHYSKSEYARNTFEAWGLLMGGIEIGKKKGLSDVKIALDNLISKVADLIAKADREEKENE